MRQLDAIDERILVELRTNGRVSHAQLGEIVRLSRNAVRQRIERLERDGRILGYTIREKELGSPTLSATMLVYRQDRMRGADVLAALQQIPEVVECDVVAGELDLVVRVEAFSPERIQEVWTAVAVLPGVRDITTAMSLRTVIARPRSTAGHGR
ncbi:Lrp/AsnC family transcriptional regulator [Agromyces albus]|uniref:Lrp/AsnC family transcriptional regulator n=1 Tax=Agromyces albus TaxID=205332 RepID=A0A4Q2L0A1_9MICO|nr:Lrp/AsnC family transcriptional regulator [Agromyces albus]RXZ70290.1 Lrp/AsnC family transcriptional regulator [Agromyces albus]